MTHSRIVIFALSDNYDCGPSQACRDYKCVSVCAGQCGLNAECNVRNHIPVCSCPHQYTGDPLVSCRRVDPGRSHLLTVSEDRRAKMRKNGPEEFSRLPGHSFKRYYRVNTESERRSNTIRSRSFLKRISYYNMWAYLFLDHVSIVIKFASPISTL